MCAVSQVPYWNWHLLRRDDIVDLDLGVILPSAIEGSERRTERPPAKDSLPSRRRSSRSDDENERTTRPPSIPDPVFSPRTPRFGPEALFPPAQARLRDLRPSARPFRSRSPRPRARRSEPRPCPVPVLPGRRIQGTSEPRARRFSIDPSSLSLQKQSRNSSVARVCPRIHADL